MFVCLLLLQLGLIGAVKKTIESYYPRVLEPFYLRGDECGLNWDSGVKMDCQETAGDVYRCSHTVECDESKVKQLEVKVLINDDRWMLGANHLISVVESSGNSTNVEEIYPWFFTYVGSLTKIEKVYSKELGNTRDVIYYTPPSYNENTLKVHKNVLIMHDGQNLFNPLTSAFGTAWMCQDTMDELIVGGQSDEVIIAGAYNTPDRTNEYTYIYDPSERAGGKGDLYLDWIESTLIPLTADNYRVSIERDALGILGSSLGGLISCYAGWTRSTVYGKVGCMSSSFWWDDQDFQKSILPNNEPSAEMSRPHIYMDSGTGEPLTTTAYTTQIYDYMVQDGFVAEVEVDQFVDPGAEHSESSWGPRFYVPIEFLYPPNTV